MIYNLYFKNNGSLIHYELDDAEVPEVTDSSTAISYLKAALGLGPRTRVLVKHNQLLGPSIDQLA